MVAPVADVRIFGCLSKLFLLITWVLCVSTFSMKARFSRPRYEDRVKANISFKTAYFEVDVDHFGFANSNKFKMKYLYNDEYWKNPEGPIFFYAGNEGAIELFALNSGFMWDIAPKYQAHVIFAEHRYYGDSMPFGNDSYKDPAHLQYFTSEQALADYAVFIRALTKDAGRHNPVILFGGSYGGMLAAWFRMKYPHLGAGAIAASAPIWQFNGLIDCSSFNKIVTADFGRGGTNCPKNIRRSWDVLTKFGTTDAGRHFLTVVFGLCQPLNNSADVDVFKGWLYNVYGNLAMINYPYPTSFIEPVPAWPVSHFCDLFSSSTYNDTALMVALSKAMSIYYNYTGQAKCLNMYEQATKSLDDKGWDYQACTEMIMPLCADGVSDMFEPTKWNFTKYSDDCYRTWKVRPRLNWATTHYGDRDIASASNIVFSNGHLDPWSGGGVLKTLNPTLPSYLIPEGAHHLDLRSANKLDPASVRKVRFEEQANIDAWIKEWNKDHGKRQNL